MTKTLSVICFLLSFIHCIALAQHRQIFHPEIRQANPSPVYDFLERYLSDLQSYSDPTLLHLHLKDEKVEILEGTLGAVRTITPDTPFSMNRMGDTFYQVSWHEGGRSLLTLRFPVSFELLLGMPKAVIEKQMKELILGAGEASLSYDTTGQDYELMDDGCYKTVPSAFYHIRSFSDECYYTRDASTFTPIFDSGHKSYSAANLFHGLVSPGERQLHIQQHLYGGVESSFTVKLSDWLRYCRQNDLKVYFTIEEEREDGLKALLIAECRDLNYNHMLQIIIPDNFTDKDTSVLKAVMNAFIPTQNVKSLYQKRILRP